MNRVGGRTCSVDTNRIYKLTGERRAATPPLKHCDTPGSDMEREQLDQESWLQTGILVRIIGSKRRKMA